MAVLFFAFLLNMSYTNSNSFGSFRDMLGYMKGICNE